MFSTCPRCEADKLDTSGTCRSCGYTLRIPCTTCGHPNIPNARFCGGCGIGMSLQTRLQVYLNRQLNYMQKLKIRKFAAGLSFGALLAFFAFGSMGMITENEIIDPTAYEREIQPVNLEAHANFAKTFVTELNSFIANRDMSANASVDDMEKLIELLIKHLRPVAAKLNKSRLPAESAQDYLRALHNFSRFKGLTRGGSTMMLFHFLSDFLEVNYRDFPQECKFNDIPRFHFLAVPATALSHLELAISRNDTTFGTNDPISLEQLYHTTQRIIVLAQTRCEEFSQTASRR